MVLEEEKEINIEHLLYAMFKYTKAPSIHSLRFEFYNNLARQVPLLSPFYSEV